MRWRRPVVAIAATTVVGAVALLTGCSQDPGLATQTSAVGHVLLVQERTVGGYSDVGVVGEFVVVSEACFGLKTAGGTYTAVFPPGTSIVESTEQIAIPGWGTLRLGDELTGGGGYESHYEHLDQVPASCRTSEIVVVNPFR